jgi:hypothetical protein
MTRKQYLTKVMNKMAQKSNTNRLVGVQFEHIAWTMEREANRKINWGDLAVTIAEMMETGEIIKNSRFLRKDGPDSERTEVPHYKLA